MTHERTSTKSHAFPGNTFNRPGNPVVIRPMQPLEGTDQSIRVDAPQVLQGPHRRTERLEEYVRWLQQQSQKLPNSQSPEPTKREVQPRVQAQIKHMEQTPVARSTNPKELSGNWSFSQSSNTPAQPPSLKLPRAKPIIEFVNKPDEPRNLRTDQPHASENSSFCSQPKLPINQFQLEADLERILRKLETAEIKANDLAQFSQPVIQSKEAASQIQSAAKAFSPRRVQPAEFVQPYPEGTAHGKQPNFGGAEPYSKGLTRNEIIQTISSAIASILTNQAEPIIEAKIKQHLKELQLELVPENEPVYESAINHTDETCPYSPPVDSQNNLSFGSPSQHQAKKEIPLNVAAWDVNEFRWPTISSQMIKVGADAIEALSRTVMQTLPGTRRRIAVTAPNRRAGTTSISISLARWVANEGGRVLLVDADLAHPDLSSLVGLGPGISWLDALANNGNKLSDAAEFIIRSQQSPICVMPLFTGQSRTRPAGKVYDQLGQLLDPVAFDFDLILVDIGPASQIVSELSCGQFLIDTALIVHQEKNFAVNQVQSQLRSLDVEQFVFAQNSVQQPKLNVA